MTPDRADLLRRIIDFDIDGIDNPALSFADRLARENGWSRSHADRVITEYKRFVFLAVTVGRHVCPSEDVDAAWHLHLTYTKSYWKRFCGELLGQPLHHEPTKGGPAEADKHLRMYADTLTAYRETFGESPPGDIWTPPDARFGDDLRHRSVNTARNWVIPKAPVMRAAAVLGVALSAAVLVPGCAGGGLNPFNLVGAEFLVVLIPVMIAAVCLGRLIRYRMKEPGSQPGDDDLELSWEQAAYLAGGYPRLTTATITRLVGCGAARVDEDTNRLVPGEHTPPGGFNPVESAVYGLLPVINTGDALKPLQQAVEARFGEEARRLESEGFMPNPATWRGCGCLPAIPLLAVILFLGVPRLVMGLMNDKPSGYLLITLIFGGILGLILSFIGPFRRTRRGDAVLSRHQARHAALKTGGSWDGTRDAAMAVALFGTAALAGSSIAYLQTWYPRQTSSDAGSVGSGCGTSGCGAGGGGGGGCGGGGGGCGGCGGGGGGGD